MMMAGSPDFRTPCYFFAEGLWERMLKWVLAVTAAAGLGGTGLGGGAACLLCRDSDRMVSLLLSFAAGVMTGVVCFDLLAEAAGNSLAGAAAGVLAGCGAVGLLNGLLPREEAGLRSAGMVMAAAIAIHNVPEGMVMGAAFARDESALSGGGILLAVVIGLHNIPEGMALAVPMRSGGMGRLRVCALAALAGAPTVLGAGIGYGLGTLGPGMLTLALGFASGAMLYVVFGELLPEAAELRQSGAQTLAAVAGILVGMGMTCG